MHDSGLVPSHQSMKKFAMDAWIRDLSLKYKFWAVNAVAFVTTLLLVLYPALKPSQLVGTDLVQAVPLVAAASLGHLLYGQVSFGITTSLLIGAIPGAFIGGILLGIIEIFAKAYISTQLSDAITSMSATAR